MKLLILWDEFGQQARGDMQVFLIEPKDAKQREKLLSMHGKFVNSVNVAIDDPVNAFSELVYQLRSPLRKYKVKWPIQLTGHVTIIHTGFLP